ncbi:MAG: class I SAM-dependent methyltransferase [Microcoleus sp. PH2017_40_RAT_O_B]|jgi:SAM-dependent methyltransferase|uniref:class I SAM-dependent methyltransferase n=1 Tax=unclassified Microcoleus TaxID=2642155 RepID=UPI001D3A03BC|nr:MULTISPECIES: class I SAM-dependent methyltransferase [unclassified Microcoleus]MCC3571021.1 class I SAM-dependent methyltransferase [Microcoleus sp. PH2017_34_RAT_O_A]MCC3608600.1 class I SAM-dependent methyltransferase [Microcoleus sp. PH2017_40_RAT_O_B]
MSQTLVKILETVRLEGEDSEALWAFNIDNPNESYTTEKYEVICSGWVLGKKSEVVAVEIISDSLKVAKTLVNQPRPDVGEVYPKVSKAGICGFYVAVELGEMLPEGELRLDAIFSDKSRLAIAAIKFQKKLPFLEQVEVDLQRSRLKLQQAQQELERARHKFVKTEASAPSKSADISLFQYAHKLSDREWFEVLVKSIDNPVINGIEMPTFPPDEMQKNYVGSSGESALKEAFKFYSEVKHYAVNLGRSLTPESRILDFGCGWGRYIRFFLKDVVPENLYGIDVDPEMVDICQKTVRYGKYSTVKPQPPAGFADNTFDVIYAYSVFSHLSETVHIKWVEEFSKILKPGGILVATTQSRNFIEFCRSLRGQTHSFGWYNALANSFIDTEATLTDYDEGKFLYSPTGGGSTRDASFYGEAIISPAYVNREWTKYLNFHDFVDDPQRCNQAIIFMQKGL